MLHQSQPLITLPNQPKIQLPQSFLQLPPQLQVDTLCKVKLAPFIVRTFKTVDPGAEYLHNWHVDLIAEYLEACSRREITRLIINIPPRSMKSMCVSVAWPAWLLGKNPSERVLAFSYAGTLATKHSLDCRLVIKSPWYQRMFPDVVLTDDQDTKTKFMTTRRGQRLATSFGASAIGDGGNFIIVDDPLNPEQALSDNNREYANTWFDQNIPTRLDDKKSGVIVVVMQRLHANDVAGHLLKKGGWEHLYIPAVAPVRQVFDFGRCHIVREAGSLLHEKREDLQSIEKLKTALGSYAFSGQYQQEPTPLEGGMIKSTWFKRYDKPREKYLQVVQSWDTAIKGADYNDPSVCLTWGLHEQGYDLLQALVRRLEYPELKRLVISQHDAFGADSVLIEDKGSGQQLLQDFKREAKIPCIGIMPMADKITRLSAVSALIEAGKVFLPVNAPWLADYEAEMLQFPNAAHDDQVDATSQFLDWTKRRSLGGPRIRSL